MKDRNYYQPTKVKDIDIDNILIYVDSCVKLKEWETLSDTFYNLYPQAEIMPIDIILAYVIASAPGVNKIQHRTEFINKCKQLHPNEEYWKGL